MIYDEEYVDKWRERAITDASNLVAGETYYREDGAVILSELISWEELDRRQGRDPTPCRGHEVAWFVPVAGEAFSLRDHNIGGSYNPWLLFDNEEDAKSYYGGLEVEYEPAPCDYWMDHEWDYDMPECFEEPEYQA